MEITIQSQQTIAQTIVGAYNNGEPISIKNLVHNTSNEFIHGIYKGSYALYVETPTEIGQRDFFIVIQHCLFLHSLYKRGLIILDKSQISKKGNDYTSNEQYKPFSFKDTCGDDDLGHFVYSSWSHSIIPTTDLIELVKDGFRTIEQKRYEGQNRMAWWGVFVAIGIGILSIWGQIFIPTTICDKQLLRIEQAINAVAPDNSTTQNIDSINVNNPAVSDSIPSKK